MILATTFCLYFPKIASNISSIFFTFNSTPWYFTHHIIQMSLAMVVILLPLWKMSPQDWGFNTNNIGYSTDIFWRFVKGYIIFLPVGTLISQVLNGWPTILSFPPTWGSYLQNLLFLVTMPGLSEEILFRALGYGILKRSWKGQITIRGIRLSHVNLITTIIFAFAHIGFSIFPFKILYYNVMQLVFATCLGLLYGHVYEQTGSLIGPILIHNASDGITVTTNFLITKFMRCAGI